MRLAQGIVGVHACVSLNIRSDAATLVARSLQPMPQAMDLRSFSSKLSSWYPEAAAAHKTVPKSIHLIALPLIP